MDEDQEYADSVDARDEKCLDSKHEAEAPSDFCALVYSVSTGDGKSSVVQPSVFAFCSTVSSFGPFLLFILLQLFCCSSVAARVDKSGSSAGLTFIFSITEFKSV